MDVDRTSRSANCCIIATACLALIPLFSSVFVYWPGAWNLVIFSSPLARSTLFPERETSFILAKKKPLQECSHCCFWHVKSRTRTIKILSWWNCGGRRHIRGTKGSTSSGAQIELVSETDSRFLVVQLFPAFFCCAGGLFNFVCR